MPSPSEITIEQYEEELRKRVESLSYLVNGLEHYAPYERLCEGFKQVIAEIDSAWHLTVDWSKLQEMRVTKLAMQSLLDELPRRRLELEAALKELSKLQNKDAVIDKDYDPA